MRNIKVCNVHVDGICCNHCVLNVDEIFEIDFREMKWRLTLRLLMSYIYMEHLFFMSLGHTQRRSTVGRTPLDE